MSLSLFVITWISLALFGAGFVVWWRGGRGQAAPALVALALWALGFASLLPWFSSVHPQVWAEGMLVWYLTYLSGIAFLPAIVIHLASLASRRSFRGIVWGIYLIPIAIVWSEWQSHVFAGMSDGAALAQSYAMLGAILAVLMYIAAFVVSACYLYPVIHEKQRLMLDRRRDVYSIIILTFLCIGGAIQWIDLKSLQAGATLLASAMVLLLVLRAAIRVKWMETHLTSYDGACLLLASGAFAVGLVLGDPVIATGILIVSIVFSLISGYGSHMLRMERVRAEEWQSMAQEYRALAEAKSDFIAFVSHQLRAPVSGIRSALAVILQGEAGTIPDRAQELLELSFASTDRLSGVIERSLMATRLDVGAFHVHPSWGDVEKEVEGLVNEIRLRAQEKKITIRTSYLRVPPALSLDHEILKNALSNVLDNAVKYTDGGSILVELAYDGRQLVCTVQDSGQGIEYDKLKTLFVRYHPSVSRDVRDGSGLGLYIARKLVELVGGDISATSRGMGHGMTFRITMAAADREESDDVR